MEGAQDGGQGDEEELADCGRRGGAPKAKGKSISGGVIDMSKAGCAMWQQRPDHGVRQFE